MKCSVSLMMDGELFTKAKAYAEEKSISFSRLTAEALLAVIGDQIDKDKRALIEERIAAHPGRKPLTQEELEKRWAEYDRLKEKRRKERHEEKVKRLEERAKKFKEHLDLVRGAGDPHPFRDDLVWNERRGEWVKEEDLER